MTTEQSSFGIDGMDEDAALGRLRRLIGVPTVSNRDEPQTDWAAFDRFVQLLPELYPLTHAALERELVDGRSLLYRWVGRSTGDETVLMAHYDVVPAPEGETSESWEHPPFAAEVTGTGDERVLWGRGTLDDKGALAAILEAIEHAVAEGFQPEHDVYLSFGHNEETSGSGAPAIVDLLRGRGVTPTLVVDEGGAIVEGVFPGVADPIAVVGVTEKGIVSVVLSVEQQGGHASTPPRFTATARLARAIVRINRKPFPARLSRTTIEMIRILGARSTGPLAVASRNTRLFEKPLLAVFSRLSDETNAMVRTTTAVTELTGSPAANVLAERASATVNVRIAVGSSVEASVRYLRRVIADPLVRLEVQDPHEPSPVSPTEGEAWERVCAAIARIRPDAIVTPYVMLGASDSRHFTAISRNVYRFTPFEMTREERATLHAMNERMHVRAWLRGIGFYAALLRSA